MLHRLVLRFLLASGVAFAWHGPASGPCRAASPLVPGTGTKLTQVGDDFEDEAWEYVFNGAKSSEELNQQMNRPTSFAKNGRWYEGVKRGHPDVVKRVPTPAGGLPGSQSSLLLQSLRTGTGFPSHKMQQDDFVADVESRVRGAIPVGRSPSVVTRVFLPPVDQWENRTGPHFAFRLAVSTLATKSEPTGGIFGGSRTVTEQEVYWPGFFIEFESKEQTKREHDSAYLRIRANSRGLDFKSRQIETTGWWTMGLSCTPDGMVHYYARPGIEDLTDDDYLTSQYPYSYRAQYFQTFFYCICNGDDGKTWSTQWIIDDPAVYVKH